VGSRADIPRRHAAVRAAPQPEEGGFGFEGKKEGMIMRNIWLVLKHEVAITVSRASFWLMTFLMPAMLLAVQTYGAVQDSGLETDNGRAEETEETSATSDTFMIGLVDEAELTTKIPPDFPSDLFLPFADESSARAALEADEIEQYVHIPADYVLTGEINIYDKDFQILSGGENTGVAFGSAKEWMLRYLINLNLTGDAQLVNALQNPTPGIYAERHVLNPPVETDQDVQAMAQVVASVIPYVFYFVFLIGSSYLMRSVVDEKENRTVEVLLLSLNPRELMLGKILGLSVVTLLQLVIWLGGGMLSLNRGSALLNLSSYTFPPSFIVWGLLFLPLGFLLYASFMAAAGAIAPTAREGNQVMWLLILPLMPTLMFGSTFVEEPDSLLTLILSLFPFSAPSAMLTRLAVGEVPFWQIFVSLAGLAITTYLAVTLSARFFKAGNLLSNAAFNWRRFASGWREN
jgi:ABC-2 type transport system permease protein